MRNFCRACLEPITEARLRALPGATHCVRCADAPYVRPAPPTFPAGNWKLLEDATEAPVLRLAEPERKAEERAEHSMYRQIESLEEIEQ